MTRVCGAADPAQLLERALEVVEVADEVGEDDVVEGLLSSDSRSASPTTNSSPGWRARASSSVCGLMSTPTPAGGGERREQVAPPAADLEDGRSPAARGSARSAPRARSSSGSAASSARRAAPARRDRRSVQACPSVVLPRRATAGPRRRPGGCAGRRRRRRPAGGSAAPAAPPRGGSGGWRPRRAPAPAVRGLESTTAAPNALRDVPDDLVVALVRADDPLVEGRLNRLPGLAQRLREHHHGGAGRPCQRHDGPEIPAEYLPVARAALRPDSRSSGWGCCIAVIRSPGR